MLSEISPNGEEYFRYFRMECRRRGLSIAAVESVSQSPENLAENLDKRTDEISIGLTQFSNSGLKQFEAFAVDGRRTLAELQKVIKNIDQHPSRLIFGQ